MKLLKCHIDSFGCLSNFDLDFQPGLTVLRAPNGFGKSTLAAFIRCMFYGMPRGGGQLEKNLRKRYCPWQGGAYGGTLDFQHNGQSYRVARRFGAKSTAGDSYALYTLPDMQRSMDYPQELGLALFGLDAASFERSTFLPQNAVAVDFNQGGIQAKLNDLVEATDDVTAYERAMKSLQNARRELLHQNERGGRIYENRRSLQMLDHDLADARLVAKELPERLENLDTCKTSIAKYEQEIDALNESVTEASAREADEVNRNQYLSLKSRVAQRQREAEELTARYPGGLPEEPELEGISAILDEAIALSQEDTGRVAYARAAAVREQLTPMFVHSRANEPEIPDEAQLSALQQMDYDRVTLQATLQTQQLTEEEEVRFQQLARRLSAEEPNHEDSPEETKKTGTPLICVIIGIVLALGGTGALLLGKTAPAVILFVLGLLAFAGAGYFNLQKSIQSNARALEQERQAARRELQRSAMISEYQALMQRKTAYAAAQNELRGKLHQQEESLLLILRRYLPDTTAGEISENLARLRKCCRDYSEALDTIKTYGAKVKQNQRALQQKQEALHGFFSQYLPGAVQGRASLQRLYDDRSNAVRLARLLADAQEELKSFVASHNAELRRWSLPKTEEDQPFCSVAELRDQITEVKNRLEQQRRLLPNLQEQAASVRRRAEKLPALEDRCQQLTEQIALDEQRVRILDKTQAYLAKARQELSEGYLYRIQNAFGSYLSRIAPMLTSGQVSVDSNLTPVLVQDGLPREAGYFSAGCVDMITLCMRLALVDALFEQAEPLIILDDPFVNLDDENTARALALLKELQQDHQILYLVCSNSRTLQEA